MKILLIPFLASCLLLLTQCEPAEADLASVESRKEQREGELLSLLTSQPNGWLIHYKPDDTAGTFLMLMEFNENGNVRIQSDLNADNGAYRDQTISFRIDHDLATELILETYAAFHYLYELNQNSFGGEFEFIFNGTIGDNLSFQSKSDTGSASYLLFEPASSSDVNLLSTQIFDELISGTYRSDALAGLDPNATFQIYFEPSDISLYTTMDLVTRRALIHGAAIGKGFDEVVNSATTVDISQLVDLEFSNEEVTFQSDVNFTLDGNSYSLTGFSSSDYVLEDTVYCTATKPSAQSIVDMLGIGSGTMTSSIFTSHSNFTIEEEFYIHNHTLIYDENNESISEDIEAVLGEVEIFVFLINSTPRGYTDGTFTGMGFAGFDDFGGVEFYLREMEIVEQSGNYVEINLLDGTYITELDSLQEKNALFDLTDEIFSGGVIYANENLAIEDLYEIYNPCNEYKLLLLK